MDAPANSDELTKPKKTKKPKDKKHQNKKKKHHDTDQNPVSDDPVESPMKPKKRKHKNDEKEHKKTEIKPKAELAVEEEEDDEVKGGGGDEKVRRAMEDERFAAARADPRFRPFRWKEAKVAIDARFGRMLSDPSFAPSAAPVDKRGKRRRRGVGENPMLHYYLNQEEEEEEKKKVTKEEEIEEEEETSSTDEEDEEEEEDDEYSVSSDIAHFLMASHEDTPMIENETHRLAVVNMDWDHIKAVDLYVVMTSCLPKGGKVLSVKVYPSEFGLKCMEIESTQGPSALVDANDDDSDYDSESDSNKLRTYELNRLRYYHAVVVCDSSATANHLYKTLDGTEFLKTSNTFDLRFIPDSMEFIHSPRDVATEAPASYKEPNFETRALQHSRVKLSWDDDEPERKKVLRQKFNLDELDELNVYLADSDDNDTDGDDVDNNDDESLPNAGAKKGLSREERLARLQLGDESDAEKSDDKDMEITFNTELENLSKRILEKKDKEPETVWGKYLEKRKEKRKARKNRSEDSSDSDDHGSQEDPDQDDDFFVEEPSDAETRPGRKHKAKAKDKVKRKGKDKSSEEQKEQEATKAELELLVAADQDAANGPKGYNLKPKKDRKGKKGKDKPTEDKVPEVDVSKDERFSAIYKSPLFALDPTDPQYKRSGAYIRKQSGKQGVHADRAETEPLGDESYRGSTLPSDDVPTNDDNRQSNGASIEKTQLSSTIRSLKRNLGAFNNASKGSR